jgi:acetyl esterase
MTRPDVAALLSLLPEGFGSPTPDEARAALRQQVPLADLPFRGTAVERRVEIPTRAGGIEGILFDARSERTEPAPIVVWFHGGGFVTGDLETHRSFAADTARELDLPLLLVDYRLAPEHPFPAAVEDAEDAARWAATLAPGLVLAGDSAGGTLAIVTALRLRDRPAAAPVRSHLVIYPATDLSRPYPSQAEYAEGRLLTEESRRWYYDHYRADPADVSASPLLADLAGLPPAVVLTAEEDPVRDEGRAYAAALALAGVPVTYQEAEGNIHAFVLMRQAIPSSQADLARAFAALRAL